MVSCMASFRSLFLQPNGLPQPLVQFNPPASRNFFLQLGIFSGRRLKGTQDASFDTLTVVSYKTNQARRASGSNTGDSTSSCSSELIGLQEDHVKEEVELVNESA